jgi:hypothetical protein
MTKAIVLHIIGWHSISAGGDKEDEKVFVKVIKDLSIALYI